MRGYFQANTVSTGSVKKTNLKVIDQHIRHCVQEAFSKGNGEEKIDEVINLIDKYAK